MSRLTLLIKTDQPQAELWLYADRQLLGQRLWQADRQLSVTLLTEIKELLGRHQKTWPDIQALGIFAGPGSFTGLRIGHASVNALAYSLGVPVYSSAGDNWQAECLAALEGGKDQQIVRPDYGRGARITKPRK